MLFNTVMKTRGQKKITRPQRQVAAQPDLTWYSAKHAERKRLISALCERIVREFQPEQIILFGSQAQGRATLDSDIDLLVVLPFRGSPLQQAAKMLSQLAVWMPIDLIVRRAEDVQTRMEKNDPLMQEIIQRGKVMYAAADS